MELLLNSVIFVDIAAPCSKKRQQTIETTFMFQSRF